MSANPWRECVSDDSVAGTFRVHRRAFTSDEVLTREARAIFERCWIYVGHSSEIPDPGDFRARDVAGRPLILVRGSDGEIRVLLNTCTHRGSLVCRERSGNSRSFQCPYHAWSFDNRGRLVGTPGKEAYSEGFERSNYDLGQPPRTENYRGFVFVSFASEIEDLPDYLAGAKEYLDLVCDQSEAGMEIVGGTQEYSIAANWKLLVENSIDAYHGVPTHMRYFKYLVSSGVDLSKMNLSAGASHDLGNGHAVIEYDAPWGRPIARWVEAFGEAMRPAVEAEGRRLAARFGSERATRMAQMSRNLLIFPNLVVNDIMAITVRTFWPVAPNRMDVSAWTLAPVGEAPEQRSIRLENFLTFLGPGGFATPDDVEMLESCQRGFANVEVEWSDISRGMGNPKPLPSDELQMRAFWRRWQTLVDVDRAERPTAVRAVG
jgi:p-cumate 2,3-dioxygenase alpha subunit